jgi:hypothetical protein
MLKSCGDPKVISRAIPRFWQHFELFCDVRAAAFGAKLPFAEMCVPGTNQTSCAGLLMSVVQG